MRGFARIDLGNEPVPDETTVCKFRHLLEEHNLGGAMLGTVNVHLESRGIKITTGTIVDATIIHAPSCPPRRRSVSGHSPQTPPKPPSPKIRPQEPENLLANTEKRRPPLRSGYLFRASLTILSLVRTLKTQLPQLTRVRFLVEGKTRDTLAGHIDLSGWLDIGMVAKASK
jgi:IS5 family transposase